MKLPVANAPVTVGSPVAPNADVPAVSSSVQPAAQPAGDSIDFARRFGGVARLYGAQGLARFQAARVCVVGVGGVGSWIVEALARSAIGHLTLIDLDHLAESNVNRQVHALTDTLGMAKVTALAQRIDQINPLCEVAQVEEFLTADNLEELIGAQHFDFIVDAVDDVRAKTALIAYCRANQLRLVTIGSAGGQIDPTRIEVRDLCRTEQEPLLAKVRKRLRAEHGFPRGTKNKFGIDAVFSTEPLRFPQATSGDHAGNPGGDAGAGGDGVTGAQADREGAGRGIGEAGGQSSARRGSESDGVSGLNCAGFGSAVVVTAAFGLVAAAHVLRVLAADPVAAPSHLQAGALPPV